MAKPHVSRRVHVCVHVHVCVCRERERDERDSKRLTY